MPRRKKSKEALEKEIREFKPEEDEEQGTDFEVKPVRHKAEQKLSVRTNQGGAVSEEEELYSLLPGLRGKGKAFSGSGKSNIRFDLSDVFKALKSR